MSQFSDDRLTELRQLFFETAQELLQALNDEALKLEKKPNDTESVRSIRRIVHTLKGDAAASGFQKLSELAHEFEDALALEGAAIHGSLADVAFKAADVFAAMLKAYRGDQKLPSTKALREMIAKLTSAPKSTKTRAAKSRARSPRVNWSEYEKLAMQKAADGGRSIYLVETQVDPHCAMPIAARQLLLKSLSDVGEVLGTRPELGLGEASKQFQFLVASEKTGEQIAAKCRIPTVVSQVKVEAIPVTAKSKKNATETSEPAASEPAGAARIETQSTEISQTPQATAEHEAPEKPAVAPAENILRVDAERIDNVLNLVGELIIGKSMMQQALNEFTRRYPKDVSRGRFADAMAFQSRVLSDLQRSVMKVRMVPVEQLFRRFPRMVRDLAKQCGREVELVLHGQDTDLDKSLLDALAEPLTHLVRNAVSHGIENPDDRTRAGKPGQGTIQLDAYHQGNQVVVEISDNGRGIDGQKVKARAVERGLVSAEEAGHLSEADVLSLIFRPGFSTAEEITEISGRGVGLDIVQSVLQRLKGTVQVETRPGRGTTFRLRLPLTLAIIKALLFRVERRLYALPLNSVAEIARARESDLHEVDSREVLQLRNQVLPVIRLGSRPTKGASELSTKIFVLVITLGERRFGLLVNSLEGEEELVIKSLDDQTIETDLISGASILGDGRVVLILNLGSIVHRFAKTRPEDTDSASFGLLLKASERAQAAHAGTEARS